MNHNVELRIKRHRRVRAKVHGTAERPRLAIFRSTKHIYAQVINDDAGVTLAAASSLDKGVRADGTDGGNIAGSKVVGALIAARSLEAGISTVVFDRGGFPYHGRIKAIADAAREGGLKF